MISMNEFFLTTGYVRYFEKCVFELGEIKRAETQDQGAKLWAPQVSVNRAETQDLRGPIFGAPQVSVCKSC